MGQLFIIDLILFVCIGGVLRESSMCVIFDGGFLN